MPEIFSLYGELRADPTNLVQGLRRADELLKDTTALLEQTEQRSDSLGKTTAVSARGFEKLNDKLADAKRRAGETYQAFQKGEATYNQVAKSINNVARAADNVQSKLKDANARLTDFAKRREGLGSFLSEAGFGRLGNLVSANSSAIAGGALLAGGTIAFQKAIEFTKLAIDKATEADRANRLLAASATEAGKSYEYLAAQNKKFAESVGLSTVAAASTTAKVTQLAAFSGNTSNQNIERLLKSFADLGAARGIDSADLNTLIGTILSGQDEGLNRLGIADPGKLYEAYAKSIGTTSEKLSQFQKVQAAANAVLEKSQIFAGAAEARMNSLEGQVAKMSSAWDNFTTALAKNFTQNLTVQAALKNLSDIAKNLNADLDTVLDKARKGILTTADIQAASKQNELFKGISKGGDLFGGLLLNALEFASFGQAGLDKGRNSAFQRFFEDTDALRADELRRQINAQLLADTNQKKAAEQAAKDLADKIAKANAEAVKKTDTVAVIKSSNAAAQQATDSYYRIAEAKLKAHLDTTRQQELNTIREVAKLREQAVRAQIKQTEAGYQQLVASGVLSASERIQLEADTAQSIAKLNEELALQQISAQREIALKEKEIAEERKRNLESIRDTVTSAFASISQNPFVTIFDEAGKAIERVQELTKDFSKDIQNLARTAVESDIGGKIFKQRIDSQLSALSLRREAETFRKGGNPNEQFITSSLYGLSNPNEQLVTLENPLSTQKIFSQRFNNQFFTDEQKKIQKDLREQIDLVRNTPFRDLNITGAQRQRFIDQAIIDLTRGIDAKDLSGDLRTDAARAREAEAFRIIKDESKAVEFFDKMIGWLNGGAVPKVALSEDSASTVRIINEAPDKAKTSTRPTPATTAARYEQ